MGSVLDERFDNKAVDFRIHEIQKKDPWFAAMLSLVVPGLGQFVCGNMLFGLLELVTAAFIAGTARVNSDYSIILWAAYGLFAVRSAYYAYKDTRDS